MTTGADCTPGQGTLFAGRYRLQDPLARSTDDTSREQHWRGFDEVLARPVLITVLEATAGKADELLTAAIANGRVAHPGVASVFDAAHVDGCTYVVSEWVDGTPLTTRLREGPLEVARAASVLEAAATALAVLHSQRLVHGNLHPDNVVLTVDGGVKLTDLRTNADIDESADVRCLGALLYASLTGRWPGGIVGSPIAGLPEAPLADDRICSPRQVRAGVPGSLSNLAMRALHPEESGLTADRLAFDLSRHADESATGSPPASEAFAGQPPTSRWRRIGVPVAVLVVIAVVGLLLGVRLATISTKEGGYLPWGFGGRAVKASPSPAAAARSSLQIVDARILDPSPRSDHTELKGAERVKDGDLRTVWRTDDYKSAAFGGLKNGMGVLIDLGSAQSVHEVTVDLAESGGSLELRAGDTNSDSPDAYRAVGTPDASDQKVTFSLATPTTARYWLIWLTSLPPHNGGYGVGVAEVHVR